MTSGLKAQQANSPEHRSGYSDGGGSPCKGKSIKSIGYGKSFCPFRALGNDPVPHGDAMGYELVAPSGREHQIVDNHLVK